MVEHVLAFGQLIGHGITRRHVRQEPQRVGEVCQQVGMAKGEYWLLRAHLELVSRGLRQRAANKVEPLLHVVLVLELRVLTLAHGGEEDVEVELVELALTCNLGYRIGHLIGHQHHAGQGLIRVLRERM